MNDDEYVIGEYQGGFKWVIPKWMISILKQMCVHCMSDAHKVSN